VRTTSHAIRTGSRSCKTPTNAIEPDSRLRQDMKTPEAWLRQVATRLFDVDNWVPVQRKSTATSPSSTDLIRLTQARDLHQRPAPTLVRLVHTEEVTSSITR
jgi:hypothetical protein